VSAESQFASEEEFLAAACEAVRQSPGADALDALGWWELLRDLGDEDSRLAVMSLFRAQGRELASSGAFGALLAQPYAAAKEAAPGGIAAAVLRRSARRGEIAVVVGEPPTEALLVDRPGAGAALLRIADVSLRRVEIPGRIALHEVDVDLDRLKPIVSERDAAAARRRSQFLGRVALSLELLGAAEGVLALAVEHASNREQFGQPIGAFQAVRHLLAWARTDCAAILAVARKAIALDQRAPVDFDAMLKAVAGRSARRACERTLQVFGGIGFTDEHDHHHFHSRVLALDSLLGASAQLARELGARLRAERRDPGISRSLLVEASPVS
jgi:alkylation response protein AidB-like acyl-CoA dehydrogenase